MSNTDRIELRFPEERLIKVDAFAATQGVSRSEAIRRLINMGLAVAGEEIPQFSPGEKLIFLTLAEISANLKGKGNSNSGIDLEFTSQAIKLGHMWAVPRGVPQNLFKNQVASPESADFVRKTLELWKIIERSVEKLEEEDRTYLKVKYKQKPLSFLGFDVKQEFQLKSIADFLITHNSQLKSLALARANREMAETYEIMLLSFEGIKMPTAQRYEDPCLTREQLENLFDIAHGSNS